MTSANQLTSQTETPESAVEQLERLLPSLKDGSSNREVAEGLVGRLTVPADPAWLMSRVGSLLLPYFEKDAPQSFREMAMEDWANALEEYPKWAVHAAVHWWQSDVNTEKKRTPLHGDITARIKFEMGAVRAAQIKLAAKVSPPAPDPVRGPPATLEQRAAIMAEFEFNPDTIKVKRFGAKS